MCIVLLPPGVNPIAVNKYTYQYQYQHGGKTPDVLGKIKTLSIEGPKFSNNAMFYSIIKWRVEVRTEIVVFVISGVISEAELKN